MNSSSDLFQELSQILLDKKGLVNINPNAQKGGFGSVFSVEDKVTKQRFAVKAQSIINPVNGQIDQKKLAFCESESKILKSANHKNVVEYHSDYTIGFYHFLQMNLCECSLDDWILKRGNQQISQALFFHFLHQILDGIDYLHSQNYVMRDLSTKNILITTDGVVKLCDFGLAQKIDKQQILASQIQSFNPKGVFIYFPPELIQQIENENTTFSQSKSGDIWALGICLSLLGGVSFIEATQFNQENAKIKDSPLLDSFCNSIIKYILNPNRNERPSISQIRKYVYNHLNSQVIQLENKDISNQNKYNIEMIKNEQKLQNIQFKFTSKQQLEDYYNMRDLDSSLNNYKEIEQECLQNTENIESLLKLSNINLYYYSNFKNAEKYQQLALKKNAEDPDVYLIKCEILSQRKWYEQTNYDKEFEENIQKAENIFPNYWRVKVTKMKFCYNSGQKDKAYSYCMEALKLRKDNPELLISQYLYQINVSKKENNVKLLEQAEQIKIKYLFYDYYIILATLSYYAGKYDKFINYSEQSNKLAENPEIYYILGFYYGTEQKNKQKAKYYFQKAVNLLPTFLSAKNKLNNLK